MDLVKPIADKFALDIHRAPNAIAVGVLELAIGPRRGVQQRAEAVARFIRSECRHPARVGQRDYRAAGIAVRVPCPPETGLSVEDDEPCPRALRFEVICSRDPGDASADDQHVKAVCRRVSLGKSIRLFHGAGSCPINPGVGLALQEAAAAALKRADHCYPDIRLCN